jgi:hypothetical protein
MGWWATASDIEYAMLDIGNFIQSNHISRNHLEPPDVSRVNCSQE